MADDNKPILNYLVKIDKRLMAVEQNMATKQDLKQLAAGMHQRFDVVDNDLNVLINHADSQDVELKKRVNDHERRIKKLESPPAVAHTIRQ